MELVLATVVAHAADHCRVRVLGESETRQAGYTEPFRPRAESVGPGCLVAIDVTTAPPLVAWRWFPATVLAVEADRLRLDEPFHGVIEAVGGRDAGIVPAPVVGDTVYVTTGLSEGWWVDAAGATPERAVAVLPQIEALYVSMDG